MSNILRFKSNPITDYLTENWEIIRDEYFNFHLENTFLDFREINGLSNTPNAIVKRKTYKNTIEEKSFFVGDLYSTGLYVHTNSVGSAEKEKMNWGDHEVERIYEKTIIGMPTIGAWVKKYYKFTTLILFHTAQPGVWIAHHYGLDSNAYNVRCHLGLDDDPLCEFDLENERYVWKNGDLIGFKDGYVYHGVRHLGTKPRTILLFDMDYQLLKPYIVNDPSPYKYENPFVSRKDRVIPEITNWTKD